MREHLLFTLYGPLQAWGAVAVGEIRPVSGRPTRSGILGLLAAALGVRRHEEERLAALDRAYGYAVRVDAPGKRLIDYHTIQTPREKAKRRFYCRRDELGPMLDPDEDLNTILSRREYLAEALFTACLWQLDQAPPHSLADLREALLRPKLTPYLGRKSCPPGWLFQPELIKSSDFTQAMAQYKPKIPQRLRLAQKPDIFTDSDSPPKGFQSIETFTVRDLTSHHGRRQFALRLERRLRPDA